MTSFDPQILDNKAKLRAFFSGNQELQIAKNLVENDAIRIPTKDDLYLGKWRVLQILASAPLDSSLFLIAKIFSKGMSWIGANNLAIVSEVYSRCLMQDLINLYHQLVHEKKLIVPAHNMHQLSNRDVYTQSDSMGKKFYAPEGLCLGATLWFNTLVLKILNSYEATFSKKRDYSKTLAYENGYIEKYSSPKEIENKKKFIRVKRIISFLPIVFSVSFFISSFFITSGVLVPLLASALVIASFFFQLFALENLGNQEYCLQSVYFKNEFITKPLNLYYMKNNPIQLIAAIAKEFEFGVPRQGAILQHWAILQHFQINHRLHLPDMNSLYEMNKKMCENFLKIKLDINSFKESNQNRYMSFDEFIRRNKELSDGVYYVNLNIFRGKQYCGQHALSIIKLNKELYIWDSNVGLVNIKTDDELRNFFNKYETRKISLVPCYPKN